MMLAIPVKVIKPDGITAVKCVLLIKVVGKSMLFQRILELGMKFMPVAVSRNVGLTAVIEVGFRLAKAGTGLGDVQFQFTGCGDENCEVFP